MKLITVTISPIWFDRGRVWLHVKYLTLTGYVAHGDSYESRNAALREVAAISARCGCTLEDLL